MTPELLIAVLSSSVISGVLGAAIAGWFNLRSKQNEYVTAYYKLVLERRIKAYEELERLIVQIKIAVVGSDGEPYHMMFSSGDDSAAVYRLLFNVMSNALWISDDLFEKTRELNLLVYSHSTSKSGEGLLDFAKQNYEHIAELRTQLERLHARDMLSLYDVPGFLRSKKPEDSFTSLPSGG